MKGVVPLLSCLLLAVACQPSERAAELDQLRVGDALPTPLTTLAGQPEIGKRIFTEREAGHCVLCHSMAGLETEFQGTIGPELTGIGSRLTPGQIRLRIVDYDRLVPGALMPSYHRTHDLYQVAEPYRGDPILTAMQVEHLVAYLGSQTDAD